MENKSPTSEAQEDLKIATEEIEKISIEDTSVNNLAVEQIKLEDALLEQIEDINRENTSVNNLAVEEIKLEDVHLNLSNAKVIASTGSYFSSSQYLVGCKWSPDGSCCLTNCADHKLRLFDLPKEVYSSPKWPSDKLVENLSPSLTTSDGGIIYDYDWYPHMSSWSHPTCCFLSSSHLTPVHLLDAFTGQIRASYIGLNYAEEIENCYSVKFGGSGDKIYCGYSNFIKIFDTLTPGRECFSMNVKKLNDQRGIISCIVENPSMTCLFAAGSYRKTIDGDAVCLLNGQSSGITHLMYSNDGTKLFSGARKDDDILCWDIRNLGTLLYKIKREVKTNQRIYFDIKYDRYLVTGNTNGMITGFDILSENENLQPMFSIKANNDCTNGISFNNRYPLIATASGQWHFPDVLSDEEDSCTFSNLKHESIDNGLKFWWIGDYKQSIE